jgi:hypothetical protein
MMTGLKGASLRLAGFAVVAAAVLLTRESRPRPTVVRPARTVEAASAPAVPPDLLPRIERILRQREYRPSTQTLDARGRPMESRLHFANRGQDLRAYFGRDGMEIQTRTAAEPQPIRLRTAQLGRPSDPKPVVPCTPSIARGEIRYDRGGVVEYYTNVPQGIEQFFRFDAAPPGQGPLEVEIEVADAARPPRLRGGEIALATREGREIRYGKLLAHDADRRVLPSELAVRDQRIVLRVDDAGARYPVTIDPFFMSATWVVDVIHPDGLIANNNQPALGTSVAFIGDVDGDGFEEIAVGAPGFDNGQSTEGAVFVFRGAENGPSTTNDPPFDTPQETIPDAWWAVESNRASAELGASVAGGKSVNGDAYADLVVGAPKFTSNQAFEGAVFVFYGSPEGLPASEGAGGLKGMPSPDASWATEGNLDNSRFGFAVALMESVVGDSNPDLVVGAPRFTNGVSWEGAVFVFAGSAGGLSESDGGVGLAGAPGPDSAWAASCTVQGAEFGTSISGGGAFNNDAYPDLAVGAPLLSNGQFEEGAVFVFYGSAAGLPTADVGVDLAGFSSPDASWAAESDLDFAHMGWSIAGSVSVTPDVYADLAAGAPGADLCFLFAGSVSGLVSPPLWVGTGSLGSEFGYSVASGPSATGGFTGYLVVGAPAESNGVSNAGSVRAWRDIVDFSTLEFWSSYVEDLPARYGQSIAFGGRCNGDFTSDLLIGAPGFSNGQPAEGAAFAFFGTPTGLPPSGNGSGLTLLPDPDANWAVEGLGQQPTQFGLSVAMAGDVDGDGFHDLAVGLRGYDGGQPDAGAVFVFYGSAGGLPIGDGNVGGLNMPVPDPSWAFESYQPGAQLGWAVALIGDVNGDGFGDLAVSAPGFDNTAVDEGIVYVFYGSSEGLDDAPSWTVVSSADYGRLGDSLAGGGSFNNDAHADLVVGARAMPGLSAQGVVFVYYGSDTGLPLAEGGMDTAGLTSPDASWAAEHDGSQFGISVSGNGNFNGDAFADLVVGATLAQDPNTALQPGAVFVFYGSAAGLPTADVGIDLAGGCIPDASWAAQPSQNLVRFGGAVAAIGSVNGDAYGDLAVGAPLYDHPTSNEGAVFVFHGSAAGLPTADVGGDLAGEVAPDASWAAEGNYGGAQFGTSVAGGFSVNTDAIPDLVVGAPFFSWSQPSSGGVFVYFGSNTGLPTGGIADDPPYPDAQLFASTVQEDARLGVSVAVGDVNGDGRGDIAAAAPFYDTPFVDAGRVFVFMGDTTPPVAGEVYDGPNGDIDAQTSTTSIAATWTEFVDPELQVEYFWAVGTTPGGVDVFDFTSTGQDQFSEAAVALTPGTTYYVSVKAVNAIGLESPVVTSDGVIVDTSGPTSGAVNDGAGADIDSQASLTTISANWSFSDPQSGITQYEWAIGTTAGGEQVQAFVAAGSSAIAGGLSLSEGVTYYVTVRATNGAGLTATASSDGVTVTVPSPVAGTVLDGLGADIDTQASLTAISANWSGFSDPLGGALTYAWAIGTTAGGQQVQAFTGVGAATSATAGSLSLSDGSTYYVTVRATSGAGKSTTATSDGVTVDVPLPLAGTVRDGSSPGTDIDTQTQTTMLAANWSGFSDPAGGALTYEWAIGTTSGGTEAQAFVSVGAATVASNGGLILADGTTYYVTVRATTVGGTSVTATSDGVLVQPASAIAGGTTVYNKKSEKCGLVGLDAALVWVALTLLRRRSRRNRFRPGPS